MVQCVSERGLSVVSIGISIGTSRLIYIRMVQTEIVEEGADILHKSVEDISYCDCSCLCILYVCPTIQ